MRRLVLTVSAAALLATTGCGGDDSPDHATPSRTATDSAPVRSPAQTSTAIAPSATANLKQAAAKLPPQVIARVAATQITRTDLERASHATFRGAAGGAPD